MNTITMSAIMVTLFFGGPDGPISTSRRHQSACRSSGSWSRRWCSCFIYVWFRAALPRLRYDQLMDLGWKRLIPLTLGWLLVVAGIVTWGWGGLGSLVPS